MVKAVYPGSFDPVTNGHIDVIKRAAAIVDEVIIGVLVNKKKSPFFTMEERFEMLKKAVADIPNVRVKTFEGTTVDFAKENGAKIIVRGLRAVTDYENEMQIAQTNRQICEEIETLFLITSLEYAFLSSTIVKEIASFGKDVSSWVPEAVEEKLKEKFGG
ncbi:MAG: pantetheine-phosphate adenylyltransferase [Catonella sp.]|uniref:pantetheine-phosphate adenylyltransferase n=1 Tax=Catonella sp. TaxID=2382125 RepID=UPI003F9F192F